MGSNTQHCGQAHKSVAPPPLSIGTHPCGAPAPPPASDRRSLVVAGQSTAAPDPPLPMSSSAVWPPHTTPPFLLFKHQADPVPSLFPSWLGWRSRRRRSAKIRSQPLEVLVLFQSEAPRPYSISRVAYCRSRARSSPEFVQIVSECHRHPPSW
jgi:hypothetical protein